MSTSLDPTTPAHLEAEPTGHDYRLTPRQYRRTIEEKIIPETDQVELRDGLLCWKLDAGSDQPGSHYRLTPDQYRAMAQAHILTADDRIELLEGWLVAKMTKYPKHEMAKGLAQDLLTSVMPPGWFVAIEGPTETLDSEPEPDLMIVRGSRRNYPDRSPVPTDVAMVVEVAYSSLSRDRGLKKRLYARSGYPIFWLINLKASRIEVYTQPTGSVEVPDYQHREDFGPDDRIPLVIDGREISQLLVRDLLP